MTRQIKFTFWLLALLFLALISILVYRQAFSQALALHPGNHRALLAEYSIQRGSVFTADGQILAESVPAGETFNRQYPFGDQAAAITGYWNPILGRTGLEASYNRWLVGEENFASVEDCLARLSITGNGVTISR